MPDFQYPQSSPPLDFSRLIAVPVFQSFGQKIGSSLIPSFNPIPLLISYHFPNGSVFKLYPEFSQSSPLPLCWRHHHFFSLTGKASQWSSWILPPQRSDNGAASIGCISLHFCLNFPGVASFPQYKSQSWKASDDLDLENITFWIPLLLVWPCCCSSYDYIPGWRSLSSLLSLPRFLLQDTLKYCSFTSFNSSLNVTFSVTSSLGTLFKVQSLPRHWTLHRFSLPYFSSKYLSPSNIL